MTSPAGYPLVDATARFQRAQLHLGEIDKGIQASGKTNRYRLRRKSNADGSEHIYHLGKLAAPSALFATRVSDCLHNLRACLDNLVFRLAELNQQMLGETVSNRTADGLSFPICKTREPFEAARPEALKGTSDLAKDLVHEYQPYNRANPAEDAALWVLRKLQDVDKHRFLVRIQLDVTTIKWAVVPGYETEMIPGPAFQIPTRLEDDERLCTILVNPPNPKLDLDLNPDFSVVFDEGPAEGQDVVTALSRITAEVGRVLRDAHKLPEVGSAP